MNNVTPSCSLFPPPHPSPLSSPLFTQQTGQLYCLQARPIVTLPPSCFFDVYVPGTQATLWDNSNIVESYAGVTSPLTFSFASHAYEQVWGRTLTKLYSKVVESLIIYVCLPPPPPP